MSIDYKSKTTRHSRTTFLKTDDDREEALREGTKHQNEFQKMLMQIMESKSGIHE